jgi:putative aminopeptidase FrvX
MSEQSVMTGGSGGTREERLRLLEALTQVDGAPGHEGQVKAEVRRQLAGIGSMAEDAMGSLIATAKGNQEGPVVLLAAHLDEVGFMVRDITPDGFVRFAALGDWWDQVLLGQRVSIGARKGNVLGIIGAAAPHLLSPEQRKRTVPLGEMFIDVGSFSLEETRDTLGVSIGDPIVPVSPFTLLRDGNYVLSKALDDRIGCALIIECLQALADRAHQNSVYGAFTVREEIGRANSSLSGWDVTPDVCLILEVGLPADTPFAPPGPRSQDRLGGGVTLVTYDGVLLPHQALVEFVLRVAEEEGIPCQPTAILGSAGGTGTHAIMHDVPSVCLGVPIRYAHSHASLMYFADYERAASLVIGLCQKLDAGALRALKEQ